MLIVKPDYYDEFKCVANECEDTCCAGWQIVIDEESMERYEKVEGAFSKNLKDSIDWEEGVFCQDEQRRCAFLNAHNLCDLYAELGKESLCNTCRDYPRHIEEFENVREYTLSISCPEVAKLLLNRKEPVTFPEYEEEGEEEFEDFDFLLYSRLLDARTVMLDILWDRTVSVQWRAFLIWQIGIELQEYMDEGKLFSCEEIFDKYTSKEWWPYLEKRLEAWKASELYEASLHYFKKLFSLELLRDDWEEHLQETASVLYGKDAASYKKLHRDFADWLKQTMPDYEIWLEQLLVYFLQTYFCGAVYDGYIASKVKMSIVSTWQMYEMMAARWHQNGGTLEQKEMINIVYRYSRELEHSDWNLEKMEELLEEDELFSAVHKKEKCDNKITGCNLKLFQAKNGKVPCFSFPGLEATGVVEHLFTTKLGGVSKGIFESMNVSYTRGDEKQAVDENYRRIAACLHSSVEDFVCSDQTHTDNIRIVTKADCGKGTVCPKDYQDVDGLITGEKGIVLSTFFADCVPLFFVDPVEKVIGLSHSGWKGTVQKIGKKTVEMMQEHFGTKPENVRAAIGPSICQACYEVSEDVIDEFKRQFEETVWGQLFYPTRPGKFQLNLWEANRLILLEAGVLESHIEVTDVCTCCNPDLLFSHRATNGKRGNLGAFMKLL